MRTVLARLALAAGLAALALFGVLLAILPGEGEERAGSTYSFDPDGLRALFLTAERLGFPVAAWSDAPGRLSAGSGAVLVLAGLPDEPEALPPSLQDDEGARLRRGRDLAHYGRFVAAGGTLLVLGVDEDVLARLRAEFALPCLDDVRARATGLQTLPLRLASGEELAVDGSILGALDARTGAALVTRADGAVAGLSLPCGAGRVALLALAADDFANAHLRAVPELALLFVRVLEALGPLERVWFDEYALGGWRPESVVALAFRPRLAWLSAHLVLLLAVLVWRGAWSGPFPRDPAAVLAASPLARALGFGRLLARAGRFELLADLLRAGLLARWDARAGRRSAPGEATSPARLAALAGGNERLRRRLERVVAQRPRSEAELAALAAELAALEAELFAGRRAPGRNLRSRRGVRGARSGSSAPA